MYAMISHALLNPLKLNIQNTIIRFIIARFISSSLIAFIIFFFFTTYLHFSKSTGWPTKMSLFFLGNNFYKNKETFKIFSPQILEVYRNLLVETTLESIMFYYTFSLINTMFVPCTALLYNSTAATQTFKLSTTLLSISCGIRLISFLMMSSLVCGLFSQTPSFRYPLRTLSGGLRFQEQDGQGLSVLRDMSLSHGKLCLRYSKVLFDK